MYLYLSTLVGTNQAQRDPRRDQLILGGHSIKGVRNEWVMSHGARTSTRTDSIEVAKEAVVAQQTQGVYRTVLALRHIVGEAERANPCVSVNEEVDDSWVLELEVPRQLEV